ncbi:MAG: ankyrin repeat domain-containing protein [Sulfurovum sp.]|nr:ankyrin repeat domain-containing protein [Sulfurovum sp.]
MYVLVLSQLLLENGADTKISDNNGMSPLMLASWENNIEMIKLLIEHGASLKEIDNDGFSAFDYISIKNNKNILEVFKNKGLSKQLEDKILTIDTNHGIDKNKLDEWLTEQKNKHELQKLSKILNKFSSDEKIRYTNHPLDEKLNYDIFRKDLEIGFEEISADLESLSDSLHQSISDLLFSEDETIQGWSSEIIKNEIEQGSLSSNLITELQDKVKKLIVVKPNDKKISLLKRFIEIRKSLKKEEDFELNIDLNSLKEITIDKFFTDTKRFEQAIETIFQDINENSKDDTKEVIVEASEISIDKVNMIEIRIIHIDSHSSQNSEDLKDTISKNGGNFKSIYNNLLSVCDWSIDTVCSDGRYRIEYLYPQIDNNKPHCNPIEDTIRSFTHILRFYK